MDNTLYCQSSPVFRVRLLTEVPSPYDLVVGGTLNPSSLTEVPSPYDLVVGGTLNPSSLTQLSLLETGCFIPILLSVIYL